MTVSLKDSYAFSRSLAKRTAGNFYFSFLTLHAEQFRAMCALYGFMRVSDDLGDDPACDVVEKTRRLKSWREQLQRALQGDCSGHAVFPALRDVVSRFGIPPEYLHAVIDGVESDVQPSGFAAFDDLARYCYQVAGAVGLCCVHIWGFHDERALSAAVDCGTAFQLTNILRDLGEDSAMGRVYLPQEDLARFGYSAEDLAERCRDERFTTLMRFEVERARSYYRKAEALFDYLEPPGQPILAAMLKIYGGLLDEIERAGYDVFRRRVSLPRWRKLCIAFGAILRYRVFGRLIPRKR